MDDKGIPLCGREAGTPLGERLNGIQEVSGSIPLISTKLLRPGIIRFRVFLCYFPNFLSDFPGLS